MKSTTRYSLIIFGFFVFIILAPLLILYVSGTSLNFDGSDTKATGILDAKTNPSNAKVLIDGKEHSDTPAIARFLKQGEYVFTLNKDGYYDWSKRLPIESGKVTYAQVGVEEIQLIKKSEPITIAGPNLESFKLINNEVWYTQLGDLNRISLDGTVLFSTKVIPSPIIKEVLRDNKHFLVDAHDAGIYLMDSATNQFYLLPENIGYGRSHQMASDDTILALTEQGLSSYNINTKQLKVLRKDTLGFTTLREIGYFLKTDGVITSAVWDEVAYINEQTIIENAPIYGATHELIITDRKELFLNKQESGLFRVGSSFEKIADNTERVHLDLVTNEFSYKTSTELGFYNFITSKPQLLTRSSEIVNSYFVRSSLGYAFVIGNSGLELIEIDARDRQNRYQLLGNKTIRAIELSANQKTIVALVDGSLLTLEIRN